jgi:hypothetical protein
MNFSMEASSAKITISKAQCLFTALCHPEIYSTTNNHNKKQAAGSIVLLASCHNCHNMQ